MNTKPIFCLVGPSCSGKTTVWESMKDIQCQFSTNFTTIVSHTTRDKRCGEEHGVDYYYVNNEEFDKLDRIEEVEYAGNRYCIAREEIDKKLSTKYSDFLVVIVDYHGYNQIRERYGDDNVFFVYFDIPRRIALRRMIMRDKLKGIKRFVHAIRNDEFNREDYDILVEPYGEYQRDTALKLYKKMKDVVEYKKQEIA